MKAHEILARLAADPMAEFATRPPFHADDVCLVRGLSQSNVGGVWRYREVKYAGQTGWSIPFHDDPGLVSSRELIDPDEARAFIANCQREAENRGGLRRESADACSRLDALGVRATPADGGLLVANWRELLALLEADR